MKAKDYADKYPMKGSIDQNKEEMLTVVKTILSEAPDIILQRKAMSPSAKAAVYHELRKKFIAYLNLIKRRSDGKMKLFDALMIPLMKGERK